MINLFHFYIPWSGKLRVKIILLAVVGIQCRVQCIAKKYFDEKDSSVCKVVVLGLFRMHSEANRVHNLGGRGGGGVWLGGLYFKLLSAVSNSVGFGH